MTLKFAIAVEGYTKRVEPEPRDMMQSSCLFSKPTGLEAAKKSCDTCDFKIVTNHMRFKNISFLCSASQLVDCPSNAIIKGFAWSRTSAVAWGSIS